MSLIVHPAPLITNEPEAKRISKPKSGSAAGAEARARPQPQGQNSNQLPKELNRLIQSTKHVSYKVNKRFSSLTNRLIDSH